MGGTPLRRARSVDGTRKTQHWGGWKSASKLPKTAAMRHGWQLTLAICQALTELRGMAGLLKVCSFK
jgi:hypothetical protein